MQQLETNLNFISSLPDRPAMETQALKREFDKAGNVIKDYINNILIPDLSLFETEIQTSIQTRIDTALTDIREEMSTLQTTLEGQMTTLQNNVNSQLNTMNSQISTIAGKVSQIRTQDFSGSYSLGDGEHVFSLTPSIPSGYQYLTANWTRFTSDGEDAKRDEPHQPFYRPDTGKIVVHTGSGQIGRIRTHNYTIRAFYIKIS
jgi:hypothetical protein